MFCLGIVYVFSMSMSMCMFLSMCCLCFVYVYVYVPGLSMFCLCIVYVLSMCCLCICVVYSVSMLCPCLCICLCLYYVHPFRHASNFLFVNLVFLSDLDHLLHDIFLAGSKCCLCSVAARRPVPQGGCLCFHVFAGSKMLPLRPYPNLCHFKKGGKGPPLQLRLLLSKS